MFQTAWPTANYKQNPGLANTGTTLFIVIVTLVANIANFKAN